MTTSQDISLTHATHPAAQERQVGWYRHPHDPRQHRYWDGRRWSDQPLSEGSGHPA